MKFITKVTVYTCDACGQQETRDTDDDLPHGIYGQISEIHGTGGFSYEFYSHLSNKEHIYQAVVNARDLSNANPDEYETLLMKLIQAGIDPPDFKRPQ